MKLRFISGHEGPHSSLDIVLVHGPGETIDRCWAAEPSSETPKYMWLKEFVDQVKNIRLLEFNYEYINTSPTLSLSPQAVEKISRQLAQCLDQSESPLEKQRGTPVALVAHGMGGIYVKQALVSATSKRRFPDFIQRCKLLVFFGTPHRALPVNPWKDILTNALSTAPNDLSPNRHDLTEGEMEPLSMFINNLSTQFINIFPRQRIINVISHANVHGDRPAIDSYSCATGHVHELNITRHCEYQDIGKFSAEERVDFFPILDRFCTEIAKKDSEGECKSQQYDACLSDLAKLAPPFVVPHEAQRYLIGYQRDLPSECLNWLESQSSPIITVAMPGIAEGGSQAVQLFRESQNRGCHACYFSFPTIDATTSSITRLVASLAFQIMARDPERFDGVRYFYLGMKKEGWLSPFTLTTLLRLVFDTKSASDPIHIIVDGLHRCNSPSQIIDVLNSIFMNRQDGNRVKLALFYQENKDIENLLGKFDTPRMHCSLSAGNPAILDIDAQVNEIRFDIGGLSYCQRFMLSDSTRDKSGTEPLPTDARTAEIRGYNAKLSQFVKGLPAKVEKDISYQVSMLSGWAQTALGWILHSKRPLSYGELAAALSITDNKAGFNAPRSTSRFFTPNFVFELHQEFGFLLTTETGGISFSTDRIRQICQEIFASHRSNSKGSVVVIPGEPEITRILLQYLSSEGLQHGIELLIDAEEKPWKFGIPYSYSFLDIATYATQFWVVHYREAEKMDPSSRGVLDILHEPNLLEMWPNILKFFDAPASWPKHDITTVPALLAQLGLTNIVTEELVDSIDFEGWKSALNVASYYGHYDMVKLLLKKAPEQAKSEELTSALLAASIGGHDAVMHLFLNHVPIEHVQKALLQQATELGDEIQVGFVLKNYEIPKTDGHELLRKAAHYGHASIVQMLLACPDIHPPLERGYSAPIIIAAKAGHYHVIKHLLPLYEETDAFKSGDFEGAVRQATKGGHTAALTLLCERLDTPRGSLLGRKGYLVGDLLYCACYYKQFEVAKLLLQYDPLIGGLDHSNHTTLFYAVDQGVSFQPVALGILKRIHDDLGELDDGPAIFLRAAELGLIRVVERCLVRFSRDQPENWPEDYVDDKHRDAVHYAAKAGRLAVVRLLSQYAKCDQTDDDGCTPLALAAAEGHREVVDFLMGFGPNNKEEKVSYYVGAVNYVCQHAPGGGDLEILKLLLEGESDPNAMDVDETDSNITPTDRPKIEIHFALRRSSLNVIRLLREHGADIHLQSEDGQTALHHAASNPHSDARTLCQLLIEEGHSPSRTDMEGRIPFHMAAQGGNTEVLDLLMGYGQDLPHFRAHDGRTPLHFAVGNNTSLRWLLQRGADLKAETNEGKTVLMLSRMQSRMQDTAVILEYTNERFFSPGK